MSATAIYVWAGGRTGGIFHSTAQAFEHCRHLTNDHRRDKEIMQLGVGAWRYVGPRGRRHGTRLVAFIGTRVALEELGVNVTALAGAIEQPPR